ncbi:MFS general substrate transporter [Aureobasidium sp. EXF-10727]|nr:MFS general substrate transporter [Aureobasidium sp. EXF-10727]
MGNMKDNNVEFVEELEHTKTLDHTQTLEQVTTMGTVKLTDGDIVYIPAPTADPQDPLNCPVWQKWVILIIISCFSAVGLALVSGFGGLLGFYIPAYVKVGKGYADITHLMTYPTLFMGIGNIIGMPFALGVGRRIIILMSTLILVVGAILCATAKSYEWHLAARCMVGLAAGQSEALVPMITQEMYFLHERSKYLMTQQAIQVIITTIYTVFASPIAGRITPEGWYGLGAGLAGLLFVCAALFLPETKYDRPLSSYQEAAEHHFDVEETVNKASPSVQLCTTRPELDFVRYAPRTFRSDLRLWVGKPDMKHVLDVYKQMFGLLLFPNVFWALCLNGLTLGANIAIGTTYGGIVTAAPYNWKQDAASYVNIGQIVVAIIALPLLGHGSDRLVKWRAQRNGGIHEPENRILPLILPLVVGVFSCVLYGLAAQNPTHYHWFTYVWVVAAYYFAFVGANIVAITYLLDSYPARAGPLLVIVCAMRGVMSFGVSYGIQPMIQAKGYDGAFGIFAALTAAFGLLGVPIFIWGKNIRAFTGKYTKDKEA